jgi:hypothetical protein
VLSSTRAARRAANASRSSDTEDVACDCALVDDVTFLDLGRALL